MFIVLLLLGLVLGSFLNVIIYRIPRGQGIVLGRSRCPHCHRELAWYDLIPVISYVLLRAHCRSCSVTISPSYVIIELLFAGIVVWSWYAWGSVFGYSYWLFTIVLTGGLLALLCIDLQHLILPDSILIFIASITAVFSTFARVYHVVNPFGSFSLASVACAVGLGGSFFLLWFFSKGRWIGFGDIKLFVVLGLVFGLPGSLIVTYLGVIMGGIIGIVLLATGRGTRTTKLPLGTFLSLGAFMYIFFHAHIIDYLGLFFR